MSCHRGLSSWTAMVSTQMPHLSQPQVWVLALWSDGIAMTRSCGRRTVATFLALLLRQKVATVAQRLYEWCCEASQQAPRVKRWRSPRALCPSSIGLSRCGPVPNWPWPSMRRPWGHGSWSSRSVWSLAGVRSPEPGRFCPPTSPGRGAASGDACGGGCARRSHPTGPCWC
jgi:hypothetical protein